MRRALRGGDRPPRRSDRGPGRRAGARAALDRRLPGGGRPGRAGRARPRVALRGDQRARRAGRGPPPLRRRDRVLARPPPAHPAAHGRERRAPGGGQRGGDGARLPRARAPVAGGALHRLPRLALEHGDRLQALRRGGRAGRAPGPRGGRHPPLPGPGDGADDAPRAGAGERGRGCGEGGPRGAPRGHDRARRGPRAGPRRAAAGPRARGAREPVLLAGMVGAVLFKGALIAAIVGLLWRSARLAILTGFGLAQIGEFSFVLARQGGAAGVISPGLEEAFLGAAILTMAATPFLMRAARRLGLVGEAAPAAGGASELADHVLVIGYGVTGQAVARALRETGVPFVAVDMVADAVEAGRRETMPVRFGDASPRAVLEEMGAERARAAVVAVGDPAATRRIVSLVRQTNPTARILVRARRVGAIGELERLEAEDLVVLYGPHEAIDRALGMLEPGGEGVPPESRTA